MKHSLASVAIACTLVLASCGGSPSEEDAEDSNTTAATSTTDLSRPAMTTEPPPTTSEPETTPSSDPADRYADLELHAGYWIIEDGPPIDAYERRTLRFHSVHHVDVPTRRMTVYAQSRLSEQIDGTGAEVMISPPQLEPGTCGADPLNASTVCAHANAVYLDGSGRERTTGDGTGAWWVKHSWILDGDGYRNCELMPPPRELLDEDSDCIPVIGQWEDDELTMRLAPVMPNGDLAPIYNERRPLLDRDPVTYWLRRVDPRPDAPRFELESTCLPDEPSPFDGQVLGCPTPAAGAG